MKKSIFIISVLTASISLMAFGYMNKNKLVFSKQDGPSCQVALEKDKDLNSNNGIPHKDLVYNIDSRYLANTTKEILHHATSIIELVPKKATTNRTNYQNSRISILHGDSETTKVGESDVLNSEQLEFVKSMDYSTNLRVTSICSRMLENGSLEDDSLVYYITITPEQEATYEEGQGALIEYLRENSKNETVGLTNEKLQPARFLFTVTKEAKISNVKLGSTSGYDFVDQKLMELIQDIPGEWSAATNENGVKVDQEYVFFFGKQGC